MASLTKYVPQEKRSYVKNILLSGAFGGLEMSGQFLGRHNERASSDEKLFNSLASIVAFPIGFSLGAVSGALRTRTYELSDEEREHGNSRRLPRPSNNQEDNPKYLPKASQII